MISSFDSLPLLLAGDPGARDVILRLVDRQESETQEREVSLIAGMTDKPFCLAAVVLDDWNRQLSPWEAPPVFGREGFGSGAGETLELIISKVLPKLDQDLKRRFFLCGYSLAGLFALWSAYRTDVFAGVAAVSPSVWFDAWTDHASGLHIRAPRVYLSLGDREKLSKNPRMARVEDCIRFQDALLERDSACVEHTLKFNPGGHFNDPPLRCALGAAWLLER